MVVVSDSGVVVVVVEVVDIVWDPGVVDGRVINQMESYLKPSQVNVRLVQIKTKK